jgi:hypothetical protein
MQKSQTRPVRFRIHEPPATLGVGNRPGRAFPIGPAVNRSGSPQPAVPRSGKAEVTLAGVRPIVVASFRLSASEHWNTNEAGFAVEMGGRRIV